jgi:hypothetical protein
MPEEGDEPHLRFKWQADRIEVKPPFATVVVEDESRLVSYVAADVC